MDKKDNPVVLTFVEISGDDYKKALDALRELSLDMPKVCIMDKTLYSQLKKVYTIERGGGFIYDPQMAMMNLDEGLLTLFRGVDRVAHKACAEIISGKIDRLGEHDFLFEWLKEPSQEQIDALNKDIKKVLDPLDVEYSIETLRS